MKYFVEMQFPDVCFIEEAARWLVLGNIPESIQYENGHDARLEINALEDGYDLGPEPFWESDFQSAEIEIDYNKYAELKFDTPNLTSISSLKSHYEILTKAGVEGYQKSDEKIAEDFGYVQQCDRKIRAALDRGLVRIYEELFSGKLTAYGYFGDLKYENEFDYFGSGGWLPKNFSIKQIPLEAWSMDGFEKDANFLTSLEGNYFRVHLSCKEFFRLHIKPFGEGKDVGGEQIGATLISEDSGFRANPRTQHFSKSELNRYKANVLQREFQRRKSKGVLSAKREAVYAEAIEWAREILEWNLTRTTAQRHLTIVLKE